MRLAVLCYVKDMARRKTLMLHRNKRKADAHYGKWNGLGGKLEAGESPEEAVRREVKEESGLKVERLHFHGMITFPSFQQEDWVVYVFTATAFSGTLCEGAEGELHWIDDAALLELELWEGDPIFLKWLQSPSAKQRFFSAKFYYDQQGRFLRHEVCFY